MAKKFECHCISCIVVILLQLHMCRNDCESLRVSASLLLCTTLCESLRIVIVHACGDQYSFKWRRMKISWNYFPLVCSNSCPCCRFSALPMRDDMPSCSIFLLFQLVPLQVDSLLLLEEHFSLSLCCSCQVNMINSRLSVYL